MTTDAILAELRTLPGAPETPARARARAARAEAAIRVDAAADRRAPRSCSSPRRRSSRSAVGAAALHGVLCGRTSTRRNRWRIESASPTAASDADAHARCARRRPARRWTGLTCSATGAQAASRSRRARRGSTATRRGCVCASSDDRLASATTRAMQIARGYGGYVASVDMNTPASRARRRWSCAFR